MGHIQIYNIDDHALDARASMIDMDPPDHTRLPRLVNPGFIPKKIRNYTNIVRQRAGALLDGMIKDGGGDWVDCILKPILYFRRTATKDTVLSGTPIKAGDRVVMWYSTANFDETRFKEPLTFDITRPKNVFNAGFGGGGVHTCLDAGLARIELKVLIEEFLARDLNIKVVGEPKYVNTNFVNGIEHLNVRLTVGNRPHDDPFRTL